RRAPAPQAGAARCEVEKGGQRGESGAAGKNQARVKWPCKLAIEDFKFPSFPAPAGERPFPMHCFGRAFDSGRDASRLSSEAELCRRQFRSRASERGQIRDFPFGMAVWTGRSKCC